jgi:GxxExxY protein
MTLLKIRSPLPAELDLLVTRTIGALLAVHRELGSGMSESVYAAATRVELADRAIPFQSEKVCVVRYRGKFLCHQRLDLFIAESLVVEIKAWNAFTRLTSRRLSAICG